MFEFRKNNMDIAAIRKDYAQKTLDVTDVHSDPHVQFQNWLKV